MGSWSGSDQTAPALVADPVTGVMTAADIDPAERAVMGVDVSPDLDRVELRSRATEQAEQRAVALSEVEGQVQTRTDELEQEEAERKLQDEAEQKKRDEAEEAERRKNQWVIPVATYQLSARFGQQSSLWSSGSHTGVDFAGPTGTEIVAVAGGTVTSAGYSGAYGMRTVITLADGTEVWYAHQSRITVTVGQTVQPGDVTGYTGATGNTTGPHLHLEVRPSGGDPVDPVAVLASHGVQL
ncbi:M23 family metallopeptidase [Aeromicrobium sp. CF3.5]|uniref:M23 family metallopeptidase n=1 Tax=Aeromicrobium sp. CF3.5 TaxID=3373078 RepID=UPI003EE4F9C3